jgi:outer membrane protein OmpA-like peptidoglycan-associated protein
VGNYEVRLPLKEKHVLRITAPGYYPVNEIVDVSKETSEVTIARDLMAVPLEKGQSVRLNTVDFSTGKFDASKTHPELDSLASFLIDNTKVRIELGAHVESGVKMSTLKIAQDIAAYLASKGVARHRISSRGYGSTKPVVPGKTPEARLENRRIEFTFLEL